MALVAIEGIDGSGKGTQARILQKHLAAAGRRTALLGFPRYDDTLFGKAIGRFLNGEFGSLDEVHPFLAALLYAGDRFESRQVLEAALAENDFVILDRYVASNIAHQGAKRTGEERGDLLRSIREIEFGIYGLPQADLNVLLDLPVATAQQLIARKQARSYTEKAADLQESDGVYLAEVRTLYLELAANEPNWAVIDCGPDGTLKSIDAIAAEILDVVLQRCAGEIT